ncbi:MAG: redoxin domain-containing protein [Ahrensia sp.]|nr:redoxin domain-containing protein [Ahrensia sp.]
MKFGRPYDKAKELRVTQWINADGVPQVMPLRLSDLGDGYKILYCFQHWCPGCHSRGFPTLKFLHEHLNDKGFDFAAIQTVFEGAKVNTDDKLRINQERYGLKIPFGHDTPTDGEDYPTFMEDYRTAGTPWFTVIDPHNNVVHADFRIDPQRFIESLGAEKLELEPA